MNPSVNQDMEHIQTLFSQEKYEEIYNQYAAVLQEMLFQNKEEWLDYVGQGGDLEPGPLALYLSASRGDCLLLGGFHGEATQAILDYLKPALSTEAWERISALNRPIIIDMDEADGELENQLAPYQDALASFGYALSIDFDDTYCAGAYFLSLCGG